MAVISVSGSVPVFQRLQIKEILKDDVLAVTRAYTMPFSG